MNGVIYKITNLINDKVYIGQTTKNRQGYEYYFGSGKLIKDSIKKYGKENFKREILKENIHCQTALDLYEQIYIKKYNSQNMKLGYNLSNGGYGTNGYKHTDEAKLKMSKAHENRIISEQTRKKMSDNMKKRKHSDETKLKISKANKGKIISESQKESISKRMIGNIPWNKGKTNVYTKETLLKMSNSRKNRNINLIDKFFDLS